MTSYVTPESKLAPFKNALSKLNPNQTQEKLLLLSLAANRIYSEYDLTQKVINEIGSEEILKLSMEDFLNKVGAEVEKHPKPKYVIHTDF